MAAQLDHVSIDRLLRRRMIRLPPDFERQFEIARFDRRHRQMTMTAAVGIVLLIVFTITDLLLLPDITRLALTVRFTVLVPLAVIHLATMRLFPRVVMHEWPWQLCSVTVATIMAWLFAISRAPEAINYYYGVAIILMLSNVMAQPALPLGALATAVTVSIYICALAWHGAPAPVFVGAVLFAVVLATMTLYTAFMLEQNERRHYLLELRDRLRRQELAQRNQELSALSEVDPLTGIANRRSFQAALSAVWKNGREQDHAVACLMMDVDHFKALNDSLGHAEGDRCLQMVAAMVRETVRSGDVVARYGGEEFVAILPGAESGIALEVAERVRGAVEGLALPNPPSPIGVLAISIGVASMYAREGDADALLRAADAALYAAKAAGRNRVVGRSAAPRGGQMLVEAPDSAG